MISYQSAKSQILERARALSSQDVSLENALGSVLAKDIVAPIDLPPFDNSQMDGVAMKVIRASENQCIRQKISQVIKAGDWPKPLETGTCAKIMTGAPIPEGADAVVPIEDVVVENEMVTIKSGINSGQFIRQKGEDVKKDEVILTQGTLINSRNIALLAATGVNNISVYPMPRITVITCGAELNDNNSMLGTGKIYDSNKIALLSALKEIGITANTITTGDNKKSTINDLRSALNESDIIITSGGVSIGDYDFVKGALEKIGAKIEFWRVAIKPGKPFLFATFGKKLIFGLPGNPVSSAITFELFVRPALLKIMGHKIIERETMTVTAEEVLPSNPGKTSFLRGIYDKENGSVKLAGHQDSHMLKSFCNADCVIIVPPGGRNIASGENVKIYAL